MKSRMVLGLIVLSLCTSALAQKQPPISKVLTLAQFVFIETPYGSVDSTLLDSRVTPEDRAAVANVEKAIHTWGRYQLAFKPREADLIIVVRPGRLASVNASVRTTRPPQPGQPSQRGRDVGVDFGGEVGQPQDSLAVYVKNPNGEDLGNPIWQSVLDHGLDSPGLTLLKKLRDAVDAASARPSNPLNRQPIAMK